MNSPPGPIDLPAGKDVPDAGEELDAGAAPDSGTPAGDAGTAGKDGGVDGGPSDAGPSWSDCQTPAADRPSRVCQRWRCDRQDRSEGSWSGSLTGCLPGDNPVGRANALKVLNLYRFLADLPEVTDDATRNQAAQECALMMHANGVLNHQPPSSWTCYTPDGALAASRSNLCSTPGVRAVDLYMVDHGANNAGSLGHRRWILSPSLGPVGLGSTSSRSCLWVIGGFGAVSRPFIAWPPPGPFPLEAFTPYGHYSVNDTGWSIQTDAINLTGAQVTVTEGGSALPVTVTPLAERYGSAQALRFNPSGWTPQAGRTYVVTVTGASQPISYQVDVVSCP